jgi:hypothetical protein
VLAYLSRYTHRVAISNRRLISLNETGVTFRYKDYRRDGAERQRTMTLSADEFIRRFLLHVLPKGFHRIRHYGLLASAGRKANIARARELLAVAPPIETQEPGPSPELRRPCPCCGGRMVILNILPAYRPGACATGLANACRKDGVVTRPDKPHLCVEAVLLRPLSIRMPRPAAISAATLMPIKSDRLSPWYCPKGVLKAYRSRSALRASGRSQPPRCLRGCLGILKSP